MTPAALTGCFAFGSSAVTSASLTADPVIRSFPPSPPGEFGFSGEHQKGVTVTHSFYRGKSNVDAMTKMVKVVPATNAMPYRF
jgi:hypothetical protein